jgi:hypothetical protein
MKDIVVETASVAAVCVKTGNDEVPPSYDSVAMVNDGESPAKSSNHSFCICKGLLFWALLVLVGAIVATTIVLVRPTTNSSSSMTPPTTNDDNDDQDMGDDLEFDQGYYEYLLRVVGDASSARSQLALKDPNSPQTQAIRWLAFEDAGALVDESQVLQRYALVVLYYATGGVDLWDSNGEWLQSGISECDWKGVTCNEGGQDDDGKPTTTVNYLDLPRKTLVGSLPAELALLSSMTEMDVSENRLKGSIPSELYDMTNLGTYCVLMSCDAILCYIVEANFGDNLYSLFICPSLFLYSLYRFYRQ